MGESIQLPKGIQLQATSLKRSRILVVDDEPLFRRSLQTLLTQEGYQVVTAENFEQARTLMSQQTIHLALIDLLLPDRPGMDLLPIIKQDYPTIEIVVLTGNGSIESAIEATKQGAYAYLQKPFENEALSIAIRNALETARLKLENDQLKESLRNEYKFENIVGASPAMQQVFRTIEKISATDSTALITGESGTGKEIIAKAIHFSSPRAKHHLITVNCGAIPEDLLESELFGHVKGAFTGATANRMGRFEAADKGTLFLDEIGDMPLNLQVKLLRVLQERTFQAVGSNENIVVDVRIIAATNQNLSELIEKKLFREDLYYRLNVIQIEIPTLRERKEDIPLLTKFFIARHCKEHERAVLDIDDHALSVLMEYSWPGNIRELENLIEQLVVFKDSHKICVEDLPRRFWKTGQETTSTHPSTQSPPAGETHFLKLPEKGIDFNTLVSKFEDALILQALERTGWNKNQAAKLLSLNRTTLVEKLKKKRITNPERSLEAPTPKKEIPL